MTYAECVSDCDTDYTGQQPALDNCLDSCYAYEQGQLDGCSGAYSSQLAGCQSAETATDNGCTAGYNGCIASCGG